MTAENGKEWRGPLYKPQEYGQISGALWRSCGQVAALANMRLLATAQHYTKAGTAITMGLTPEQIEIGKLDIEMIQLAADFATKVMVVHNKRKLVTGE